MRNFICILALVGGVWGCGVTDAGEKIVDKVVAGQDQTEDMMNGILKNSGKDYEGEWMSNASGVKQIRKFAADGTGSYELYVQGELELEFDMKLTSPGADQFLEEVTKVKKSSEDFPVTVGMKNFCLYEISGFSGELQVECDLEYPEEFSEDVSTFVRTAF